MAENNGNGPNKRFRYKLEGYKLWLTIVSGTIGLMVLWDNTEFLPKWTWKSEFRAFAQAIQKDRELIEERMAGLEQFNKDTRSLTLSVLINSKADELDRMRRRHRDEPDNNDLWQRIRELERTLDELRRQRDKLDGRS